LVDGTERSDALERGSDKDLAARAGVADFGLRLHIFLTVTPCVVLYGPSSGTLQWPIHDIALSYATLSLSNGYLRSR
jgi:hypothetical protein